MKVSLNHLLVLSMKNIFWYKETRRCTSWYSTGDPLRTMCVGSTLLKGIGCTAYYLMSVDLSGGHILQTWRGIKEDKDGLLPISECRGKRY
jgi:hypothetical protein